MKEEFCRSYRCERLRRKGVEEMIRKTVKIKNMTIGEGMPKICVPVMGNTVDEVLAHTQCAVKAFPDFLEWRADSCSGILEKGTARELLGEIRKTAGTLPLLFTFRSAAEGGRRAVTPEEYQSLLEEAGATGKAELIDVEAMMKGLNAGKLTEQLHAQGCTVIASHHCFDGTPETEYLREVLERMEECGADILKLAVMPKNRKDVVRLIDITQEMMDTASCPVITMSMGALGAVTRISGEIFGSCVTYASAGETSAPGQLPAGEVRMIQEILHGCIVK